MRFSGSSQQLERFQLLQGIVDCIARIAHHAGNLLGVRQTGPVPVNKDKNIPLDRGANTHAGQALPDLKLKMLFRFHEVIVPVSS